MVTLRGTAAADLLDAFIEAPDTATLLRGLGGDDSVLGSRLGDLLRGGAGADTLRGDGGADTIGGGDGDDVLVSTSDGSTDVLRGNGGDDRLLIGGDFFIGGPGGGRELVRGGDGFDTLVVRLDSRAATGRQRGSVEADLARLEAWIATGPDPTESLRLRTLDVRVRGIEAVALEIEPSRVELRDIAAGRGGFWIRGEHPGDNAGFAVAGIGDVNGDGRDDLLIGAPHLSGSPAAGAAYVVFGQDHNGPIDLANVAAGIGGYKLVGEAAQDRVGWAVAGIGDVNGDGRSDLLVGAPGGTNVFSDGPAAYVVYGQAITRPIELATLGRNQGYVLDGAGDSSFFNRGGEGVGVAALGDVNGDGTPDFAVASIVGNEFDGSGRVTVVFGGRDGRDRDLQAVAGDGFRIGLESSSSGGPRVSGVGDVDKDGFADVLVLVPEARRDDDDSAGAGAAYLVFGKADATDVSLGDVARGIGGVKILGEPRFDFFSRTGITAVGSAGDVNGDGRLDLLIGAPYLNSAYVVFGRDWTEIEVIDLVDVASGSGGFLISRFFNFNSLTNFVGTSVTAAGDVNGDGLDDLLIGGGGGASIVFGKTDGRVVKIFAGASGGFEGIELLGELENGPDRPVAAAGDVNGDGLADFIVGAPFIDSDGVSAPDGDRVGGAYVIFGSADWIA